MNTETTFELPESTGRFDHSSNYQFFLPQYHSFGQFNKKKSTENLMEFLKFINLIKEGVEFVVSYN